MNEVQLVREVGEWANKNFEYHNPWLGMWEELGEIVHCILKRHQKIRGFEDEGFFRTVYSDAIGDFGIYAAHYAYLAKLELDFNKVSSTGPFEDLLIGKIGLVLGQLHFGPQVDQQQHMHELMAQVNRLSTLCGLALGRCTFDTWQRVKQRDWKKSPNTGGEDDESATTTTTA